jgi:hypothetical protein
MIFEEMHPKPPHSSRWSDAKAIWAIFWRMLLLTPVVGVFGTLLFAMVLGVTIMPPLLAVMFVVSTDYLGAVATVALWLVWLRFGGPARRFVFEGFEHGSI